MENLPSPWFLNGDKLTTTLKPETKLQMVAVDDIGKFSAKAFAEADKFKGAEIDYAGDAVTMAEAAAAMSELTGKTVTYQQIPIAAVRANSEDFAKMLEWFDAGRLHGRHPVARIAVGHPSAHAQAVGPHPEVGPAGPRK